MMDDIINDFWELRGILYEKLKAIEKKIKKMEKKGGLDNMS